MTTLTSPDYQIILRSHDGTGEENNQKTFTLDLRGLLNNTFVQYNVRAKFWSAPGPFEGSVAEVRWSIQNTNQYDTAVSGAGSTLCTPKVLFEQNLDGTIAGSILVNDFASNPSVVITPPVTTDITIGVYDHNGVLIDNMSPWSCILVFTPVQQRTRRR